MDTLRTRDKRLFELDWYKRMKTSHQFPSHGLSNGIVTAARRALYTVQVLRLQAAWRGFKHRVFRNAADPRHTYRRRTDYQRVVQHLRQFRRRRSAARIQATWRGFLSRRPPMVIDLT